MSLVNTSGGPRTDDATSEVVVHHHLLVKGEWRKPYSSSLIQVLSANTEQLIGSVPDADPVDVDSAVQAARTAFDDPTGWSHWEPAARAETMRTPADQIDERSAEIARRVSDQNGMPIFMSTAAEAHVPSQILRYYADSICTDATEELRGSSSGGNTLVRRVPVGVVAAVAPWNLPNIISALKYALALAAGCTVELMPSPETGLDAILLGEAAQQTGMPPGVFNILFGRREAGARLVSHPGVDKVSFTGSTATGRQIGAVCGELLRPVTLELGGKSAPTILDDADLDLQRIARQLATALFANNGQTCFLTSRVLAPHGRYDEVVDVIAALAESIKVGDSLDPATQVGPLVSRRQRDRVEGYIAKGLAEGARLVVGGGRPARLDTGWFVEPTVSPTWTTRTPLRERRSSAPS